MPTSQEYNDGYERARQDSPERELLKAIYNGLGEHGYVDIDTWCVLDGSFSLTETQVTLFRAISDEAYAEWRKDNPREGF